jgi:hypothetical protein
MAPHPPDVGGFARIERMKALRIYAGPLARQHLGDHGLQPCDVGVVPAAAGGPKGLILGPLDRFIFGDWLPCSDQPVHLVGASIGAWRMATACLNGSVAAFERLEHDYIHQHYELAPGEKRPSARHVSERFGDSLQAFYGGRVGEVLEHPRFRLHIVTSRGRHVLGREHRVRTPLGYLGAFITNTVHRKAMGAWLERVVFSAPAGQAAAPLPHAAALPFATHDYRTRQVLLTAANFQPALQASCSIPFVLQSVHGIPGAPPGAYWDGGITDYHLHLHYTAPAAGDAGAGLVLYPHFQKAVVPGWLDKGLKWRHGATRALDRMVVLAPDPDWVRSLPNGKLPDRTDFTRFGNDLAGRVKAWSAATAASLQLADEFAQWLERPDMDRVDAL